MEIHFCFDCGHCQNVGKDELTGDDVFRCDIDDITHGLWVQNRFHVPCEDWKPKEGR